MEIVEAVAEYLRTQISEPWEIELADSNTLNNPHPADAFDRYICVTRSRPRKLTEKLYVCGNEVEIYGYGRWKRGGSFCDEQKQRYNLSDPSSLDDLAHWINERLAALDGRSLTYWEGYAGDSVPVCEGVVIDSCVF